MDRLTGDIEITCGDCGAVMLIRQAYQANLNQVKFCPMCGTANLKLHHAPLTEMLRAACFAHVDYRLTQMLYSVWAMDADLKALYPKFVDYLNNELLCGSDSET